MYSDEDLDPAVAAGALSAEAAAEFQAYIAGVRQLPHASEENFRLLISLNDIFVSIGIVTGHGSACLAGVSPDLSAVRTDIPVSAVWRG